MAFGQSTAQLGLHLRIVLIERFHYTTRATHSDQNDTHFNTAIRASDCDSSKGLAYQSCPTFQNMPTERFYLCTGPHGVHAIDHPLLLRCSAIADLIVLHPAWLYNCMTVTGSLHRLIALC